jgi:hypothetical protein
MGHVRKSTYGGQQTKYFGESTAKAWEQYPNLARRTHTLTGNAGTVCSASPRPLIPGLFRWSGAIANTSRSKRLTVPKTVPVSAWKIAQNFDSPWTPADDCAGRLRIQNHQRPNQLRILSRKKPWECPTKSTVTLDCPTVGTLGAHVFRPSPSPIPACAVTESPAPAG